MRSTFHGLEVAKRALFAQQTALSTTGQNISNANTEGYSRQRAEMVSGRPLYSPSTSNPNPAVQVGTGVEVKEVVRIRDQFLDNAVS